MGKDPLLSCGNYVNSRFSADTSFPKGNHFFKFYLCYNSAQNVVGTSQVHGKDTAPELKSCHLKSFQLLFDEQESNEALQCYTEGSTSNSTHSHTEC